MVEPEAALEDGLAARLGAVRHEQDARMGDRGRRRRRRLRRSRHGRQAARGQPPHRGRADRDARLRGRAARRARDALLGDPDPAHLPLRAVALLRHPRGQAARGRARRGRRLRREAERLRARRSSRSCCAKRLQRPIKWIETRSENMAVDPPRARPDRPRRDGRQERRQGDRAAAAHVSPTWAPTSWRSRRSSRSSASRWPTAATTSRRWRSPSRACSPTSSPPMRSAAPGRPEVTHWIELMMNQVAARAGHGPARGAAAELHRRRRLPARRRRSEIIYDSGNYQGTLDKLLEHFDVEAFRREQARAARAGRLPRRGLLDLRRGVRPGAVARRRPAGRRPPGRVLGVGDGARQRERHGDRLHRHLAARPGPRHGLRPDRGRPDRHRPAERERDPRRHRPGPVGLGHLRLAHAGGRRRGRGPRGAEGPGQGQAHLRGAAGGRARGHRAGRRQATRSRARRTSR